MYDSLVLGAILIHCTGQSASFAQAIKDKPRSNLSSNFPNSCLFIPICSLGEVGELETEHVRDESGHGKFLDFASFRTGKLDPAFF
ncbi:hypothetical protein FBUS_00333 [Fasciolopsis buskii]|uniref:Uncharacterized protein n=1 Tax=Fasciolopsis buskii TaxID=27845 RepID=A0A8E0S758_9TREM|nr:hypothetical protein FBUS_00333 [Fasciolopsis buski]